MARDPIYDWETIRAEYSTGQFSDSELSRRHGCSRAVIQRRKKKEKWRKDNSAEVRHVAQARMIEEDASLAREGAGLGAVAHRNKKKIKDEITLAAETRVTVLRDHRHDITKLRTLEAKLMKELKDEPQKKYMCNFKGDIYSEEISIPVTEKCQALNSLASVMSKRITQERIAFNLNDKTDDDEDLPTVILHDPGAPQGD